jgi:hypothetical protein
VSLLSHLVNILGTDETGIVMEITPDNKLIIQRADCDKYIAENKEKYINEYLKN